MFNFFVFVHMHISETGTLIYSLSLYSYEVRQDYLNASCACCLGNTAHSRGCTTPLSIAS